MVVNALTDLRLRYLENVIETNECVLQMLETYNEHLVIVKTKTRGRRKKAAMLTLDGADEELDGGMHLL